ncbi:MAG: hypothetical protein DI529_09325 [Chryseobacterium sp.]|nr:MAG: hypothetical protein DI529_09325 [Chryseobacterium sp.]
MGFENLQKMIEGKIGEKLTDEDFSQFQSYLKTFHFKKKEIILEKGNPAQYIYYIESGLIYSYYEDDEAESYINQFATEGYWISDLSSFFGNDSSVVTLETIEATTCYALEKCDFENVIRAIPKFERFFRILLQNAYIHLQQRFTKVFSDDTEKRYQAFVKRYPDLVRRVPQYLIASYLGVKPQSLSRIRKNIHL